MGEDYVAAANIFFNKRDDPFVAWLLQKNNKNFALEPDNVTQPQDPFGIADSIQEIENLYGLPALTIYKLISYRHYSLSKGLTPMTQDISYALHVDNCNRAVLDGDMQEASMFRPSIAYEVPALNTHQHGTSFADILDLRKNDEVFAEVRIALNTLQQACGQDTSSFSYAAYQNVLKERAEDILRPSIEKLQKMHRRALLKRMGWVGMGKLVGFGLNSVLNMQIPGSGGAGRAGAESLAKGLSKNAQATYQASRSGLVILKSILNED